VEQTMPRIAGIVGMKARAMRETMMMAQRRMA